MSKFLHWNRTSIYRTFTLACLGAGTALLTSAAPFEVDGILFEITGEGTAEVTEGNNTSLTSAVIPSTVTLDGKDYKVTAIGENAFDGCEVLASVTIPSSVTSIGNYAFEYCYELRSVDLPDVVTRIGDYAFFETGLYSISLPNRLTEIGEAAFG